MFPRRTATAGGPTVQRLAHCGPLRPFSGSRGTNVEILRVALSRARAAYQRHGACEAGRRYTSPWHDAERTSEPTVRKLPGAVRWFHSLLRRLAGCGREWVLFWTLYKAWENGVRAAPFSVCMWNAQRLAGATPIGAAKATWIVAHAASVGAAVIKQLREDKARRMSTESKSRFQVDSQCEEQGKMFLSIKVLPHFL